MAELYVSLLDGGRERMREVFEELTEAEGLRLFNCTAGKDRTGVVAMLLLELGGSVDEAILADYAASSANMTGLIARQTAALRERGIEVPTYIFESRPEDMLVALEHLRAAYGSASGYLSACGLSRASIARLEAILAEVED
jgi:protein-tyrosine phosphatase